MTSDYEPNDYRWIDELLRYPEILAGHLDFFEDTSEIRLPEDPIERVIFQDKAKTAIRKIAQNRGHILMVGRPGTGKSMLANMFQTVLDRSIGDYIRPKTAIVAFPGKDPNHIRIAYEEPGIVEKRIEGLKQAIDAAGESIEAFSLADPIASVRKVKRWLMAGAGISAAVGLVFPPAFVATGLAGMGAIFMYIQENNHRAQEKIQQESRFGRKNAVKHLTDRVPEILYDPRTDTELMARISEPDARKMKGGFRHDPYQSGTLQTPAHKRAYLGAHATAPVIYIDELKTLVKAGYMPDLLEVMQNKTYVLEGGRNTGSGAADRAEDILRADNIIVACCNHDTLAYLQDEGDGAFLSRIEDKGEVVQLDSAVPETAQTIREVAQYVTQEVANLGREFKDAWGEIIEREGHQGVRRRNAHIMGKSLPPDYRLEERPFSRQAVLEIIKEMRCRASDRKLSTILRPVNGLIKSAEYEAIFENAGQVEAVHVQKALGTHLSLEGGLARDLVQSKKELKKYIGSMTDAVGYVVGLAVITSRSSGQMVGQPLPIHGQIIAGGADVISAPGKIGEIARAAAQNVRASIKKLLKSIDAPYVGYELHVEYIQAHGGVEGDSASVAIDIALISDYIRQPVNQKFGITGSLTGSIILPVGGVAEKIRSIMDPELGMAGVCIPWQNKHDIEPLLINTACEPVRCGQVPGIRIFRKAGHRAPFDIFFCKTNYNAYRILMGLERAEIEQRMADRSRKDFQQKMRGTSLNMAEQVALNKGLKAILPPAEAPGDG